MTADAAALAAAVRSAPNAPVACYAGWTLVELAGHVGQIHRWAGDVVERRASARPTGGYAAVPEVPTLPDWITVGAERLVDVLAATDPAEVVWTFHPTDSTVGFWRRRMVLETALHRWDAETALGRQAVVDDALALQGVAEALHLYMEPRLAGREVGGAGERVAFVPDGAAGWTVRLEPDGVAVAPHPGDDADAVVCGSALDLWLLLTCRRRLDGLDVTGDVDAAALAVRAATLVPGPAG